MCPDWDDTVKDRENGEVVGHIGHNETIEEAALPVASDAPIEDIRKVAIDEAEAAGAKVVDVPQSPSTGENGVQSKLVDEGNSTTPASSPEDKPAPAGTPVVDPQTGQYTTPADPDNGAQ